METQLFNWDSWDQHDTMIFGFSNVETVVELPGIPKGTKFNYANWDLENGIVEFINNNKVEHSFALVLSVKSR